MPGQPTRSPRTEKSPSCDAPRSARTQIGATPEDSSVAARVGASWGRRRAAHAGLRARASRRRRQHQARRPRCHGNPGLPVPASRRRRSRPGGAGLELLGDRQRASASAARSPSFHPSPTSAWRRLRWGRVGRPRGAPGSQGSFSHPRVTPSGPT